METSKIRSSIHCLLSVWVFLALNLSSCTPSQQLSASAPTSGPTEESQAAMGSGDIIAAHSYKELVDKSAIIVSGQFRSANEVINMARNINDINKADPNILGVGQVYQFEVDKYLKGGGPKTIYVVQLEGFLTGEQIGIELDEENIKKARKGRKHIPAKLENPYVLFLEPLVGFPDLKNYYTGAIHPWRFDLSNPDQVVPESVWEEALSVFPPKKVSKFFDQIANPDLSEGYPPPPIQP
jgi:hypothetical protein